MTQTGAIAWIAQGYDVVNGGACKAPGRRTRDRDYCNYPWEVHKVDRSRTRLLDSGFAIAPRSLQLHRTKVSWTNGRRHRLARLR
jgi:hypothetical protein